MITLPARRTVTTAIPSSTGVIPVGATVAVFEIVTGAPGRVSVRTQDDRFGHATLDYYGLTAHTAQEGLPARRAGNVRMSDGGEI